MIVSSSPRIAKGKDEIVTTSDVQALHSRLGKVGNQPVSVSSFTNKRMTINYRAPLERLRQLVPAPIEIDEIRDTGMGMISMCVCDFWVTKFGPLPIPTTHANEMLCRISVRVPKKGATYRAYYTLRSDSSSRLLGFLGGHFSHFRKAISQFTMRDQDGVYELTCKARDPISGGHFRAELDSITKEPPPGSTFASIQEATDFVFQLDGSCGYSYPARKLSFQHIEYPTWDLYFCTAYQYQFALLDYLFERYKLDAEFDCTLFMQNVPQVWGTSWLYAPDTPQPRLTMTSSPEAGD